MVHHQRHRLAVRSATSWKTGSSGSASRVGRWRVEGGREQSVWCGPFSDAAEVPSTWGMIPYGHASASSSTSTSEVFDVTSPRSPRSMSRPACDDDVTALAQRFHLTLDVGPAVDAFTCKPRRRAQGFEDFVDLHAEFAVGHSTNARGRAGPPSLALKVFTAEIRWQHRQTEAEGLTRSGLGFATDVTPGERVADREGLNRECVVIPWRRSTPTNSGRRPIRQGFICGVRVVRRRHRILDFTTHGTTTFSVWTGTGVRKLWAQARFLELRSKSMTKCCNSSLKARKNMSRLDIGAKAPTLPFQSVRKDRFTEGFLR